MARADYLCCADCEDKIVYSPDDQPSGVLCSVCGADLLVRVKQAEADLRVMAKPLASLVGQVSFGVLRHVPITAEVRAAVERWRGREER